MTSANARWNNTIAILTGDFLFAKASEITADLGTEATRILARTIAVLCEGQIRETVGPAPGQDPISHYLQVVNEKTGSLLATSGRLGAMLSGADDTVRDILARFGQSFGVAFQMSDDLLDVVGRADESGKTPGTDLREGIKTLPVLYALESTDPADARLQELLVGDFTEEDAVAEALGLLRVHPAMDRARGELDSWASDARTALEPLPSSAARAALMGLTEFVVTRTG